MQNKRGIRISAGPVVLPAVLFAGLYLVYLASLSGIYEGGGNAVGRDFVNVWTAGRFLNDGGNAAELFDFRRYIEIQKSYFSPEWRLPAFASARAGARQEAPETQRKTARETA